MDMEIFDKGVAGRRAVAGDKGIDRVMSNADDFSMPMQGLVTEYCWGQQ